MQIEAWLNQDRQFVLGQEIFRSERDFAVWAFTVSHSQLLLRTRATDRQPRIDILFKPVKAMKLRTEYKGLVIRCGTAAERDPILASSGLAGRTLRVLIVETAEGSGYVVTGAIGWREDGGQDHDPSTLAFFPPGSDPGRILPQEKPDARE
jgi:hypothetical protein